MCCTESFKHGGILQTQNKAFLRILSSVSRPTGSGLSLATVPLIEDAGSWVEEDLEGSLENGTATSVVQCHFVLFFHPCFVCHASRISIMQRIMSRVIHKDKSRLVFFWIA